MRNTICLFLELLFAVIWWEREKEREVWDKCKGCRVNVEQLGSEKVSLGLGNRCGEQKGITRYSAFLSSNLFQGALSLHGDNICQGYSLLSHVSSLTSFSWSRPPSLGHIGKLERFGTANSLYSSSIYLGGSHPNISPHD